MQLSTSNHSLAWICALKTISVSVPGSNHPHKYFCGCLDPQTEKDIDFGAWIQPPAQIFLWVLDLDTESNFIFGAWIQPPPQIFMWVLGSAHRKDIDFGAWIQPPAQIFIWVLGSRHRKQNYFWCLDPATCRNISVAWIRAPKSVFLLVPGTSYLAKYFYGCLDLGTENHLFSVHGPRHPQEYYRRHPQKYFRCARIHPPNINIVAGVWIQSLAAILLQCMDPGTHKKITMGILERLRAWLIAGFSDQSSSMIHEEFNGYSHSDADDDSRYEGLR
ncbi:hypothetical protein C8J57DRAFT_1463941 [Mycena rebaudengoi]|nr:hypothetical protein C8J57DRAFT_1476205 [Mycena rebaudengoi]KAJ7281913.1 hypothetical protein C8J57DRAFT_1463941 [Mycena rebaudengoi]